MTTLNNQFTEYLKSIMPDSKAVERAIEAHEGLRNDLEKDEIIGKYIERTLLSGSYKRDTAIHGIKDVDILVQFKNIYDFIKEKKHENETDQACLLRILKDAIDRTGRVGKTKTARRSIYVTLPEEKNEEYGDLPELTMDIVPVIILFDKDTDPMKIADKDLDQWFDTYPNSQISQSIRRNQDSEEIDGYRSYKSMVKMIKAWKKVQFGDNKTPKSFILECMVHKYHNQSSKTWIDVVEYFFWEICNLYCSDPDNLQIIPEIQDISSLNLRKIPIAKSVDDARRILNKFHWSLEKIKLARNQSETDIVKASKTLQLVFGSDQSMGLFFPIPIDEANNMYETIGIISSNHDIREAQQFG